MRVSRIQAAENRQTVINVASRLFRERGFDGIGLKDLDGGGRVNPRRLLQAVRVQGGLGGTGVQTRIGERLPTLVEGDRGESSMIRLAR